MCVIGVIPFLEQVCIQSLPIPMLILLIFQFMISESVHEAPRSIFPLEHLWCIFFFCGFKVLLTVMLYDEKLICTHTKDQRGNGRWGNPNNTLPQLLPGPSQELSAHHRPISTRPEEHRGTKAGRGTQITDSEEGSPVQVFPRTFISVYQ